MTNPAENSMEALEDKRTVFKADSCIGGEKRPTQRQRGGFLQATHGHTVYTLRVNPPTFPSHPIICSRRTNLTLPDVTFKSDIVV